MESNLNLPGSDSFGCKKCKSIFHEDKDCPQTTKGEPKFKFKSRKEMGIKQGSLPFKFRVDIDTDNDNETEVVRKRSLMRLNAHKVYNLMGYSVKAYDAQKGALLWLTRLVDELDIDDPALQEERNRVVSMVQSLQPVFQELSKIREDKIKQAEEMEEMASKVRVKARAVRNRIAKNTAAKSKKELTMFRVSGTATDIPLLSKYNPLELIKEASEAIRKKPEDQS